MSAQDVRQAIADAASSVDGITCSPNFVQTTKPGSAMVRMDHMELGDDGFAFMTTWQVAVILPSDYAAAEKFTDDHMEDLISALSAEMEVTRVTPAQLALVDATVPVVFVEGARAAE